MKDGETSFSYSLDKSFMNHFSDPGFNDMSVTAAVNVLKVRQSYEFSFVLKGWISVDCDRCLESFDIPVDFSATLHVNKGDTHDEDGEIVILKSDEQQLNIARYLYEYVMFSMPVRRVHPGDPVRGPGCNPQMLEKLRALGMNPDDSEEETGQNKIIDLLN